MQRPGADPAISEGPIERVCHALCGIGLLAMVVIVGVEVVTRNFLGFSFQISDGLGGYIIVLISFLSLCVCQVTQSYHHVEFLQARLGWRGQAMSRVVFDLICLALCLVLTWQLGRLVWNSWMSDDVAPTMLMTPLWLPQSLMPLGLAALSFSVTRTLIANVQAVLRLRTPR